MTEKPDLRNFDNPREAAEFRPAGGLPVLAPGSLKSADGSDDIDSTIEVLGRVRSMARLKEPPSGPMSPLEVPSPDKTRGPSDLPPDEGLPITIQQKIHRHRHPLSSILVSVMIHTALLIVLILIAFRFPEPIPRIGILAEFVAQPVTPNLVDSETQTVELDIPEQTQSPMEMSFEDVSEDDEKEVSEDADSVLNTISEHNHPTISEIESPAQPRQTLPTGGGLEGRDSNARARLAATRGGSRASELAVEQGIRWIVAHQREDGSWRFRHHQGECDGRCANPGTRESTTAATGLALMSLMGAGYTHRSGPYQETVQKGLDYLLEKIRVTKHGGILAEGEAGMYSHAIATIALAEAFSMTRDTNLINAVESARTYIVTAQHGKGGWRYNPGYPGDMTVTGWQLMALKSCEISGLPSERTIWQKAEQFIDSLGSSSGRFGYQSRDEKNPTTTAIGLLSKMYLGMPKEHGGLEMGAGYIFDRGPSKTDIYFNYYATQVMHHLQGPNWKIWNQEMRDFLIDSQVKTAGHEAGSWYFEDKHGQVGGRLYTTAMAVMTLEVYYRFMPLYEDKAVEAEIKRQAQRLR